MSDSKLNKSQDFKVFLKKNLIGLLLFGGTANSVIAMLIFSKHLSHFFYFRTFGIAKFVAFLKYFPVWSDMKSA